MDNEKKDKFVSGLNRIPTWTKVLVFFVLVVLISAGLLFGTTRGRNLVYKVIVGIVFDNIKEDSSELEEISLLMDLTESPTPELTMVQNQNSDEILAVTEEPTLTPKPTATPKPSVKLMDDEDIINVLLVGVENIYGAKYGRTDAMILVSVNINGGALKMVSFQRDLYVDIPGREADDRLNAAFAFGGPNLLIDTMELNFGVDIDSYVKVNFEGFEDIIDRLGGLKISLTDKEAEYLTGKGKEYISKPSERNVVAGMQNLTGSQVLGYCRVRYVPTENGLKYDWGRNYRHRVVLQAIFDQYKSKNITELVTVMKECFHYVSAPPNLEDLIVECLYAVIEYKMYEIETMQMPQSGNYNEIKISEQQVIVFHPEAVEKLQDFLYEDE